MDITRRAGHYALATTPLETGIDLFYNREEKLIILPRSIACIKYDLKISVPMHTELKFEESVELCRVYGCVLNGNLKHTGEMQHIVLKLFNAAEDMPVRINARSRLAHLHFVHPGTEEVIGVVPWKERVRRVKLKKNAVGEYQQIVSSDDDDI